MGCCHNKPSASSTLTISSSLSNDDGTCVPSSISASIMHPNRLVEFDDESFEHRFLSQIVTGMNRNTNSPLVLTEKESCRRPDPHTMLLLTRQIIDEVEQALITSLASGLLRIIARTNASSAFKAISFKRSGMKESQLDAAIIEAALTYIIDHLHERPKLVAALGTAKIGYHHMGLALEDIGVRIFVVKGFATVNAV